MGLPPPLAGVGRVGAGNRLIEARTEVFQEDRGAVSPGQSGDRSAGVGARAGLIQAGQRRAVRGPTFHGAVPAALLGRARAAVAGATPVCGISPLQVQRAVDGRPSTMRFDRLVVSGAIDSKSWSATSSLTVSQR